MSTFTLNTISIKPFYTHDRTENGNFRAKCHTRDVSDLNKYKSRGAFADVATIKDIPKMRKIIESAHAFKTDKARGNALGKVRTFLKLARAETGLSDFDHEELLKRFDDAIKNLLEESDNQREQGGNGDQDDIFGYEPVLQQVWKNYEDKKQIYEKEFPSDQEIQEFQDAVIAVKQMAFPHSRGIDATLVNAFHPDANLIKDNVFFPTEKGYLVIIWNERKVDRITKGRQPAGQEDPDYDTTRFVQPMVNRLPIHYMEPEKVGAIMSRFVRKFRKTSKFIFTKKDGTPLLNLDSADHRYAPYHDRVKRVVGHPTSKIRRSQITAILGKGISNSEHLQYSADCHHSRAESLKYARDNTSRR